MNYKARTISVVLALPVLLACVCFCVLFGSKASVVSKESSTGDYANVFGLTVEDLAMYVDRGGTYTLKGAYDGMVYVDVGSDEDVTLVLDGASIACEDGPAIYVANSGTCTLTIKEGSENTVVSGVESELSSWSIDADAQYGAITFKDDAAVSGEGSLAVYGYINNGIHCSNNLVIENGSISVTALNNGVKGNDSLTVSGGSLTVTACGRGLVSEECLAISGGDISVGSDDDALHTNNAIVISGGTLSLSSDDDGIHADTSLVIDGGDITVARSYEGIESNQITINGGNISITATDDGMNACGGTNMFGGMGGFGFSKSSADSSDASSEGTPALTINGGNVYVNADGDGLDSNGDLIVNDGYVIVEGPSNSANGSLDSGSENGGSLLVNGGTVLAIGASGMAETPESSSKQCYVSVNSQFTSGTEISLLSGDEVLFTFTASKSGSSVVLSSPELAIGSTYTIQVGSYEYEFTVSSIASGDSSGGGFGGGQGGGHGGFGGGKNRP